MNKNEQNNEISMSDNKFDNDSDEKELIDDLNCSDECPLCPAETCKIKESNYIEHIIKNHGYETPSTIIKKMEEKISDYIEIVHQMCLLKYCYKIIAIKNGKNENDDAIIRNIKEELDRILNSFSLIK